MEHQAIARRSCDQCRARKIRCDRSTPCSNCASVKVDCTRSRTPSKGTNSVKQRVLISAQYEQKIDGIAKDLEVIKSLLRSTPERSPPIKAAVTTITSHNDNDEKYYPITVATHPWINAGERRQQDNASSSITDIVRTVVQDVESGAVVVDDDYTSSSLTDFLSLLEHPSEPRWQRFSSDHRASERNKVSMPPLDAVLIVLRWAKTVDNNSKIAAMDWMTQVLPRRMFEEACQRVYFAVEDYNQADIVLANVYLVRIFAECLRATQVEDYRGYSDSCQSNLRTAMATLPLHTRPSLEMAAALACSAFTAVESSQVFMAWSFISAALNTCQTLGYHCNDLSFNVDPDLQEAQNRLFWIIYRLERSLALRFNRSSNIRDSEITIPDNPASIRHIRLGRVHGKIYDLLYSRVAMAETLVCARGKAAEVLAGELQPIIQSMKNQLCDTSYEDPTRRMSLLCEIICQSSTLCLVLRAAPSTIGTSYGVSDRCIATAREVLDMHHECMMIAQSGTNRSSNVKMYTSWNLVHVPFVPYIILFYRAVHLCDSSDLALLERFAASLRPQIASGDSRAHTFQLYEVLYHTARLHISKYDRNAQERPLVSSHLTGFASHLNFAQFGADPIHATQGSSTFETTPAFDLDSWCYDNQYLLTLLDESVSN